MTVFGISSRRLLPANSGGSSSTGITWTRTCKKLGGSLKRLRQAEAYLWRGQLDETLALFVDMNRKQAHNFCTYLEKHRHRIINDEYYQAEGICSIGFGAVESAIKQIDRRVQLSGAQWKAEHVSQVLAHRAAYLNKFFSLKRRHAPDISRLPTWIFLMQPGMIQVAPKHSPRKFTEAISSVIYSSLLPSKS